jgi:hypothetical protein
VRGLSYWYLLVLGCLLTGGAAWCLVMVQVLDSRLARYRAPGVPEGRYLWVPARWQPELYTPEGRAVLARMRRYGWAVPFLAFPGLLLLGAILGGK